MVKLIVVFAAFVSLCPASTYYVAPTGHDSNPGTSISEAWATLQHAVDMIAPGDTILVESGTYAGCRISIPGGQSMPKTLQADAGAAVVVDRPGMHSRQWSNIEVENFGTTVTDWVISGLEVVHAPGYGIEVRNTDRITIQNNHVHNGFRTGIFASSSNDAVIQGNETDQNWEHGIYVTGNSSNAMISGNTSHDNAQSGVQLSSGTAGGDGGFSFFGQQSAGQVQSATVTANTIYNNGWFQGSAIDLDGVNGSLISNNLLYNNHGTGISLDTIGGGQGSSDNQVLNNTIVMAPHSGYVISISQFGHGQPLSVGNVIENNILYTPDSNRGSILVAGAGVSGFVSDYNVVVNVFSDNNGNRKPLTLAEWQALGYDLHSLIATPAQLFAAGSTTPYQLATGSPAIDAGTTLLNVPVDILGVTRPQGLAYDIGCYELPASPGDPGAPM